ncbi:MAG: TlpA family protein disulfide reductase [Bacteroidota bacterium]
MKFCLSVSFMLMILSATAFGASAVRIEGSFPGAEGQEIRLMAYRDYLSLRTEEIDAQEIDQHGTFVFEVDIERPRLLFFRVIHSRNFFYVSPGNSYMVEYEQLDFSGGNGRRPSPLRQHFPMTINKTAGEHEDLNSLISEFDDLVADYLRTHVAGRSRANHQRSLERFRMEAASEFADIDDAFFQQYIHYRIANIQRSLNTKSFHALASEYILDEPVRYYHPQYMEFFRNLFDSYIFTAASSIGMGNLEAAVNRHGDVHALMDTLGRDTILLHERYRELVMLNGLKKMTGMKDFEEEQVAEVLRQASEYGRFEQHRMIADNILYRHRLLKPGTSPPPLNLVDSRGDTVRIDDFRGRYLYLFFWAGWSQTSMAELAPMTQLAEEAGDNIQLLGVLIDHQPETTEGLLQNDELPFALYHIAGDYRLLDRYRLRTVPYYLLIDPEGKIVAAPFKAPSEGALETLKDLSAIH